MAAKVCYFCGRAATTKEHFPPKSFFPKKGEKLKLKTVPSCFEHNNEKSNLDQYVLAHITMNQGHDLNLARRRFDESIKPQLEFDAEFKRQIAYNSEAVGDGTVRYPVDSSKFDCFFDALSKAVLFDKFDRVLPDAEFQIAHVYLCFQHALADERVVSLAREMSYDFLLKNKLVVEEHVHDHLDEFVYRQKMLAPFGYATSITILHTFYGFFDVLTLVSKVQTKEIAPPASF